MTRRNGTADPVASLLLACVVDVGLLGRKTGRGLYESSGEALSGQEEQMTNHTYRVTEIVGSSPDGIDQAIRNGIERAAQTIRHIDWFEVTQIRGAADDGNVAHFQVGLKVGFRIED
jgi:flavin-binding protein dodecin